MARRLPNKLLPHRRLVTVEPYLGGGANGRSYGTAETVERALIIDSDVLVHDQYDAEVNSSTTIYLERSELTTLPTPETRVTVRAGTPDERVSHVIRCDRYEHPRIADLLEVRLE